MAEADELCDRLAIIDHGRLLAMDSPVALKKRLGQDAIYYLSVKPLGAPPSRDGMIESVPGVRQVSVADRDGFSELQLILESDEVLPDVLAHVSSRGSSLLTLEKRQPTLEDVFIDLVGRGLDVDTSRRAGDGDD
jgi:ABC-2 type transport system ATP-binding protein